MGKPGPKPRWTVERFNEWSLLISSAEYKLLDRMARTGASDASESEKARIAELFGTELAVHGREWPKAMDEWLRAIVKPDISLEALRALLGTAEDSYRLSFNERVLLARVKLGEARNEIDSAVLNQYKHRTGNKTSSDDPELLTDSEKLRIWKWRSGQPLSKVNESFTRAVRPDRRPGQYWRLLRELYDLTTASRKAARDQPQPTGRSGSRSVGQPTWRLADSDLVVVKAVLLAWGLDKELARLGQDVSFVHVPWGAEILKTLDSGAIDVAIYNHMEAKQYVAETSECSVEILGGIGHSMGGKNFYVLAHKDGCWRSRTASDLVSNPAGASFLVPEKSDMHRNLLFVLDLAEDDLSGLGITVIHARSGPLELAGTVPDVLLVGGQNLRFEALESGDYRELLTHDDLPEHKRERLLEHSENVLLANARSLERFEAIGMHDIWATSVETFHHRWGTHDQFDVLFEELCLHTGLTSKPDVVRKILFDTYRLGRPVS